MKSFACSPRARALSRILSVALGLALLTLGSGCVNLAAVRDFAQEASTLGAHRGVSDDLVASKVRLYEYAQREPGPDGLREVKLVQEEFDHEQQTLVKYLAALAALADNDLISFDQQIAQAGDAASKAKLLDSAKVGVWTAAGNLVARGVTDLGRERKIREIVQTTDPAIQDLVQKLAGMVRSSYFASLDTERQGAKEFADEAKLEKSAGLSRLTDFVLRDHFQLINQRRSSGEAYAQALEQIGRAHATLAHHLGGFTAKEFVAQMKDYNTALKELHNQLKN